jgi:CBS domain-containing protein/RNA polymerase-binding transcription factor DksA
MTINVKAWMTGSPVTIEAGASALAALDAMIDHGIRHLPVVDARRRVVGIVSIEDLRAGLPVDVSLHRPPTPPEREAVRDVTVGDLMTHAPEVVRADTALDEAAQRMADLRVGALPVVDGEGRLEGILSETDVLHAVSTRLWTDRVRERRGQDRELGALLDQWRGERDRLRGEALASGRDGAELIAESRVSGIDEEERAADREGARVADSLKALAERRLEAIDRALSLAAEGRLAICERCGKQIPLPRLRALPGATTCVACARASEARSEP